MACLLDKNEASWLACLPAYVSKQVLASHLIVRVFRYKLGDLVAGALMGVVCRGCEVLGLASLKNI